MSRPPIGDVAMTGAERARRYRARQKKRGSLDACFNAASGALLDLWLAVLHAGPNVDATKAIRADLDRAKDIVYAARGAMRSVMQS